MIRTELVPGTSSSILGFGCASVGGAVPISQAILLMEKAFDLGINHFDVAPSYGYGEAEKVLGVFAKSRRSEVVLATKFGIEVTTAARIARPLKPIARRLISIVKGRRGGGGDGRLGSSGGVLSKMFRHVEITGASLTKGVHGSLRRLNTSYIDLLLLHEPPTLVNPDEVFETFGELKAQGHVRACGISIGYADLKEHEKYVDRFDVVQVGIPSSTSEYERMKSLANRRGISFFGAFRGTGDGRPFPSSVPDVVLPLLRADFPGAVILFSTSSEGHLKKNASLIGK